MAHFLNDAQYFTLCAICDTLVPSLEPPAGATDAQAAFWRRSASDLKTPKEVTKTLRDYAPPEQQQQVKLLLTVLSNPITAFPLTGKLSAFKDLSIAEREAILLRWSVSPIPQLRQGFQGLKRLTHALFYAFTADSAPNPNWEAVAYPGPLTQPNATHQTLPTRHITTDTTLSCDVVIIGSGAGGSVAAAQLAQAGQHVIVVEKGGYQAEKDFSTIETDALEHMYENAGVLTTKDLGIVVLAGSTLGGGTTINWQASFETPDNVLTEWETKFGLHGLADRMRAAFPAIKTRSSMGLQPTEHNAQNQLLAAGANAAGLSAAEIDRNAKDCVQNDCGWCAFGCIHGAKQGSLKTWLPDAVAAGAEIVVNCEIDRVLIEHNAAVGVTGTAGAHTVHIKAKRVIVAAGAIHTPAILLRSGLTNPNIGRHLRLHPVTGTRGLYSQKVESWRGPMMSYTCDDYVDQDGNGYGAKIETPPAHTGLIAGNWPWLSGYDHKQQMLKMAHFAAHVVLTRDYGGGRVTLDKRNTPEMTYKLHPKDAQHMQTALLASLRIHKAAGALEVGSIHSGLPLFDLRNSSDAAFEAYLTQVQKAGVKPNHIGLFSAHQMGTARMAHTPKLGAVNPEGETWDVKNLYVMDGALFPTASGVNPMLSIMAMAHQSAKQLVQKL